MFMAADLGLEMTPREEHAAYLNNWLKAMKADKRFIFQSASTSANTAFSAKVLTGRAVFAAAAFFAGEAADLGIAFTAAAFFAGAFALAADFAAILRLDVKVEVCNESRPTL